MTNEEINALYDKAEMEYEMIKDKCHDLYDENKHLNLQLDQALKDYEELLVKIDKAKECIKNRNTTKSKKERFMSGETTLEKVLQILGDKKNEMV